MFDLAERFNRGMRAAAAPVVALLLVICSAAASLAADQALRAASFKVSGTTKQTRVDIEFSRDPAMNWFLLRAPYRLVIDLPPTEFAFDPASLKAAGIVAGVRYGEAKEGRSRVILTAKKPFKVEKVSIPVVGADGKVPVSIELKSASRDEFDTALAEQRTTTASTNSTSNANPVAPADDRFTIVVDPGHGGIDGGAKSANGTIEKTITLAFAQELKKKLEESGRYNVLLTRETDVFIPLGARVAFARKHGARLFISIHADTIRVKGLRGATVYTVSDQASDAESAALADRENLADAIGGIEIKEENQEVADILADLIRRETHGFSVSFARTLLDELASTVKLINNPHRHARFRVLRAPDVPSVLVELGYLSNAEDEQQLNSPDWRGKIADTVVEAVNAFAAGDLRAGE
ncbi:MAG: N-acetylmuramoyl-L-alanine amidase [Rhizobiaceae bacterium]